MHFSKFELRLPSIFYRVPIDAAGTVFAKSRIEEDVLVEFPDWGSNGVHTPLYVAILHASNL